VHGSFPVSIASSDAETERLVKDWLTALVDRTPLAELGDLPMRSLAAEAPALVAAIWSALANPGPEAESEVSERARAAHLVELRSGVSAEARIGRDLGELQALCVRLLERELGEREPGALALASERLARIFGSIHGSIAAELAGAARDAEEVDPTTGFEGRAGLDRALGALLAEQRRYEQGFSLALVEIDGLAQINEAYGGEAVDRMLLAVAGILRGQLREVDRAFRLAEGEFVIVTPRTDGAGLATLAARVARSVAGSQSADGPRIAIAVGVVECPGDGDSAEALLERATEATYAAKAAGTPVARAAGESPAVLQDT
jgi:diguanylate cyclase (GGDEF)-like protein